MIIKCNNCNKEFNRKPSLVKDKNFCSWKCSNEYKKKNPVLNCMCDNCSDLFHRKPHKIKETNFCCYECSVEYKRDNQILNCKCDNCGKEFHKKPSHIKNINFCSWNCYLEYANNENSKNRILELHNKGYYDSDIANVLGCTRSNVTLILNKNGIKNRKVKINNLELRNRISKSNTGKMLGSLHPCYKGNAEYSKMARGIFNTISKQMIEDKNFTCEICDKHGGNMNTHHIKPFYIILEEFLKKYRGNKEDFTKSISEYEEFIDRKNLIVVCDKCHKEIHYGDNPELNPYRWGSATTIENTD